jgi:hypothetical protein
VIRALSTLVGAAAAVAILYVVSDIGQSGGSYWPIALVWAAAGLALGAFYQAGGRRSPGLRMNFPLLIFVFLPWTLLTSALVAYQAHNPVWLFDRAKDVLPNAWIPRLESSLPAFAFASGLLLAFSLLEPRIGLRPPDPVPEPVVERNPYVPETPWQPPEERPTVVAPPVTLVQPRADVERERDETAERPTVLRLTQGVKADDDEPDDADEPVR